MPCYDESALVPMPVLEEVATALRVLAHPHRLRMVELLVDRHLSVGELAELVGIPPNACSQHLNLMRANGLLSSRRNGKTVHYSVQHPSAVNVIRCIQQHWGREAKGE